MVQNIEKTSGGRKFHLDLLRAIACLSVVMIHVSAEYVVRGSAGADFWLGNLLDSLSRAGVPLFVMISGALMLDENYEFTKKKWLGHVGRMTAFYAVWSTVYCFIFRILPLLQRGEKVRLPGTITQILSGHYHLWFVPMIIGVYLVLPLLRLWVKEKNVRYVEYFLGVSAVFGFVVPQVMAIVTDQFKVYKSVQTLWDNFNLGQTAGYTVYFVLGWYLNRGVKHWKLISALGVLGFAMTFAGTGWATVILEMNGYPFYENFTVNVLVYSCAIFVFCRHRYEQPKKPGGMMQKAVRGLGRCSLGVYAVHVYVISELMPRLGGLHIAAGAPLIFVLTMVLSALLSVILGKIPLVKKIV